MGYNASLQSGRYTSGFLILLWNLPMFENRRQEAKDIALAIERLLVALGIDSEDTAAMADLAGEALDHPRLEEERVKAEAGDLTAMSRYELFAREDHQHVHGNASWKAFARALYALQPAVDKG